MGVNGAEVIIECLKEQGVDTVFGYPGATNLPLYDALYRHQEIQHVLTCHEQGAAHAADGYARASGKAGVCVATSGPGATNLVTGLAAAFMDSVPVVAVTIQVPTALLGRDAFQEVDIIGITMPVTKHSFLVKDVNILADVMRQAFRIATSGRPGPVLIDVPKDILTAITDFQPESIVEQVAVTEESTMLSQQLQQAVKAIEQAQKPLAYVGGGVKIARATQELRNFVHKRSVPVVSSLMGLGAVAGDDPLFLGLVGMHGLKPANLAACEADLIIAIGNRFSERGTGKFSQFAADAQIIHIDIDPAEIGKNVTADIPLLGDIRKILSALTDALPTADNDSVWHQQLVKWQRENDCIYPEGQLVPQWIVKYISAVAQGECIVTTEVGQHQMWVAQHFNHSDPGNWVSSGGLGAMGFGMPASIGASLARPGTKVIHFAGDGSFRMTGMELSTAVHEQLPIVTILLNNGVLGMVRQWQTLFHDKRYAGTILSEQVNFVQLAQALGAQARRVETSEQFKTAFAEAWQAKTPFLIECIIDKDEMVYPMVAPGGGIDCFVEGSDN